MKISQLIPALISIILVVLLAYLVPWSSVIDHLSTLTIQSYVSLTALGVGFYGIKAYRFWYMLQKTGIRQPLGEMIVLYLASQPAALIPLGQAYRSVLLRRHHKVPIAKSGPTILLQELIEGVVVLALACLAALIFPSTRIPVLIVAVILGLVMIGLRRGWVGKYRRQITYLNKFPLINISLQRIQQFSKGNQILLQGRLFIPVCLLSLAAILCGVGQMYIAGISFDASLGFGEALMAYVVSVIVTAIIFLPGGIGISEQGAVGMLILSGMSPAAAIAATIVFRAFNLGLGLILGFAAMAFHRIRYSQH